MRAILLTMAIPAWLFCLAGCEEPAGSSDPKRPEIPGLGDLRWGQAPTDWMEPFRTYEGKTDYRTKMPPARLGDIKVKAAVYTFREGKLAAIHLVTDSKDPRRVAAELSQRFGPPDKQKHGQILYQRGAVRVSVFQAILPDVQVEMVHQDLLDPQEP